MNRRHFPGALVALTVGTLVAAAACGTDAPAPPRMPRPPVSTAAPTVVRTPTPTAVPAGAHDGTVSKVVDGDTVHVVDSTTGAETTVRVIGIDTPETKKPGESVQCYGLQATRFATAVLLYQQVTLTADPTQDRVDRRGRALYYIRVNTGRYAGHDYSVLAVEQGYARVYVYRERPPQKIIELRAAESEARDSQRGLWTCPDALQQTVAMLIPAIDRGPR